MILKILYWIKFKLDTLAPAEALIGVGAFTLILLFTGASIVGNFMDMISDIVNSITGNYPK